MPSHLPFHTSLNAEKERAQSWFFSLQDALISAFEALERAGTPSGKAPATFDKKSWDYAPIQETPSTVPAQGGGYSALLKGEVFEKAAIHVSALSGPLPQGLRTSVPDPTGESTFYATGLSLITHPKNPQVPTAHFNTRFLATSTWWFGGGGDLTPMLSARRTQEDADAQAFHAAFKQACDAHPCADYDRYKAWCDTYFFLPHRQEPRGIGGIFYDDHNSGSWDADFAFTQDVGRAFLDIYPKIVARNLSTPYTPEEKAEQAVRRGRYVEFNLLYDRGTLFGLKTGGNVETILSSLPPIAHWP